MVDFDTGEHGSMGLVGYKIIGRKSWVAYFGLFIGYAIIFGLIYFIDITFLKEAEFEHLREYNVYAYTFFVSVFVYRLAVLRSFKISITNEGIWVNYGIFPWAKGGNGLRWNDADMAFYYPTFLSWITNSYTIKVNHKYTNSADFIVSNIWRGRRVCREIASIQRIKLGL